MRFIIPALLMASGFANAADSPADLVKKLAGRWSCSEVEIEGKKQELPMTFEFKAQELTLKLGDVSVRYSVSFPKAPSKGPRPIDLKILEGPTKGKTVLCIYELTESSKGNLRICGNLSGTPAKRSNVRPTEFATKAGDEMAVVTLTKESTSK